MDATIFSLLIENKDRGDVKNLVLFLNLYPHWKYLVQLVWNVHIEKRSIKNYIFVYFKTTGKIKWILKWKLFKKASN